MLIVDKKTTKRTKLHKFICPTCKIDFYSYRNNTINCSNKCAIIGRGLKRRNGSYIKCKTCEKTFYCNKCIIKTNPNYCSMSCRYPDKKLGLPKGQYLSYDGYIVVNRVNDGRKQIKLHRLIMEENIKRILKIDEIVHHIDGNKLNNNINNLQIVTRTEHNILHGRCKNILV